MVSRPLLVAMAFLYPFVEAFPVYQSLAALSDAQVALFIQNHKYAGAQPPPGPLQNTSAKLVNDEGHPYATPGPKDIRGPCPGLNTLASHGVSNY
jgi:unspecific peroxygenase